MGELIEKAENSSTQEETYIIKADTPPSTEIEPEKMTIKSNQSEFEVTIPAITMEDPNPPKVTKTRVRKPQVPTKSADAQVLIEQLQEKIMLIGYIAEGKTVVPSELSVKGRELYQEYEKAVQDMKNEYITKIQAL